MAAAAPSPVVVYSVMYTTEVMSPDVRESEERTATNVNVFQEVYFSLDDAHATALRVLAAFDTPTRVHCPAPSDVKWSTNATGCRMVRIGYQLLPAGPRDASLRTVAVWIAALRVK